MVKNRNVISITKNNNISLEKLFKNYKGKNLTKGFKWDRNRDKEIV